MKRTNYNDKNGNDNKTQNQLRLKFVENRNKMLRIYTIHTIEKLCTIYIRIFI